MLFLRQIDEGLGISRSLARCFYDARNPLFIEHSVRELVAQRLLGLAAGYEDLNDHNLLRLDPLFAVAVGKEDPLGSGRVPEDAHSGLKIRQNSRFGNRMTEWTIIETVH